MSALKKKAAKCEECDLFRHATQTVFGEGMVPAPIMLLGEQPGDREDREGRPFVGPAGKLLDQALAEAGIDRSQVYVTNVVKHFKWSPSDRGKRRIHKKPSYSEIKACRPWLDAELQFVKPVVVCLGATAAQAVFGRQFRIIRDHGRPLNSTLSSKTLATFHPSAILRAPDEESRHAMRKALIQDLKKVVGLLDQSPEHPSPIAV